MLSMQDVRSSPGGHIVTGRWFFCFSKQAGVVIFSSMGWAMMMTVALLNIGGEENPEEMNDRNTHYAILYCYLLPMLVGFSLLYVGSVKTDSTCLIAGLAVQCAFGIYWIVIAVMSFKDEPGYVYAVCIDNRCPETLWLYNTQWRTYANECIVHLDNILVAGPDESETDERPKQNESKLVELDGANETLAIMDSSEPSLPFYDGARDLDDSGKNEEARESMLPSPNSATPKNPVGKGALVRRSLRMKSSPVAATYSSTTRRAGPVELDRTNYDDGYGKRTRNVILRNSRMEGTGRKNVTAEATLITSLADGTEDTDDVIKAILELLSKKPFSTRDGARELRTALLGSRVLGCTENVEHSMAWSIVGALMWFVFLVSGNFGAFLLIRELRWKQVHQEEERSIISNP